MLTNEAKSALRELLEHFRQTHGKVAIPAFCWIDSKLNSGIVPSGIGIGFYTDRHEIEGDIETVDGLEVVFAMSDQDRARFANKNIDHKDRRFVLIDAPASN